MILKNTLKKNSHKLIVYSLLILAIFLILLKNNSFAGTDGQELRGIYDRLVDLEKIIVLVSVSLGSIGCAIKLNTGVILTFFGVAMGVGIIDTIVDITVTCLLNF